MFNPELDLPNIVIAGNILDTDAGPGSPKHVMLGDADCSRIRST